MPDEFAPAAAMDGAPRTWGEAFASLPLEVPAGDTWNRIAHRVDAPAMRQRTTHRERRMSWLIGVASAAVLVLAAWSPLSQWLSGGDAPPSSAVATVSTAPGVLVPAAPARTEPRNPDVVTPVATASTGTANADPTPSPARLASAHRKAVHKPHPQAQLAQTAVAQSPAATSAVSLPSSDATATSADPLGPLKLQSAQLEALIALARDERVANASNEWLSSEIDAGIAVVDAALSQSDVAPSRQQELWQQRVDLLQQLAGVEATSRWLAAQGASNETLLVSVD
ncbi:hypothetical protein [Lysobacter terrae]